MANLDIGKPPSAVLMLGFGGPTCFEEVRPFVLNVTRGRSVPPERIEAVIEQYRQIGGKSPFYEKTVLQADALQNDLARNGCNWKVYVGFLYWSPYIADALEKMANDHIRQIRAIVMAPQRTDASFGRYVRAVQESIAEFQDRMQVSFIPQWHAHALFIEAVADLVGKKLSILSEGERANCRLIFTAHSVPRDMAGAAEYVQQLEDAASLVAKALGHRKWCLAYQSRSGNVHEPWLEPDIRDVIKLAATDGCMTAVVVPLGFVCDHAEVLFDIDIQAANVASQQGVRLLRVETVGDHPLFIRMLSQLVRSRIHI